MRAERCSMAGRTSSRAGPLARAGPRTSMVGGWRAGCLSEDTMGWASWRGGRRDGWPWMWVFVVDDGRGATWTRDALSVQSRRARRGGPCPADGGCRGDARGRLLGSEYTCFRSLVHLCALPSHLLGHLVEENGRNRAVRARVSRLLRPRASARLLSFVPRRPSARRRPASPSPWPPFAPLRLCLRPPSTSRHVRPPKLPARCRRRSLCLVGACPLLRRLLVLCCRLPCGPPTPSQGPQVPPGLPDGDAARHPLLPEAQQARRHARRRVQPGGQASAASL